ncbi:hypothetical protein ACLOJK_039676 [Asimina triloba]
MKWDCKTRGRTNLNVAQILTQALQEKTIEAVVRNRTVKHLSLEINETHEFNQQREIIDHLTPATRLTIPNCWDEIRHHQRILAYNVEHLEMTTGFSKAKFLGLAVILDHSPNLKSVIIREEERDDEGYEGEVLESYFNSHLQQLKTFEIYSFGENERKTKLEMELSQGGIFEETLVNYRVSWYPLRMLKYLCSSEICLLSLEFK